MIPLAVPDLHGNEARYLQRCIETNFVSSVGPFVDQFESMLCEVAEARFAVATSSGTAALALALEVAGVRRGDLVIAPSYTFIASANSIRFVGADPWLHDVSSESWTLDPLQVRESLLKSCLSIDGEVFHRSNGRRVGAVMAVYALGHPADMDPLRDIADALGLPLVADGAAALGATYRSRKLGQLAHLTTLSFNGNKTVTCGGGGAVLTDDPELARAARHLSTTARTGLAYVHDQVGYNLRMTNLQAAVGVAQLERFPKLLNAKRRIAQKYANALQHLGSPFPHAAWAESSDWMSGLVLRGDVDLVVERLNRQGVQARTFWVPMHEQPPYADSPRTDLSTCDSFWGRVIVLPCSPSLQPEEQDFIISILNQLESA